ncbi:L,D-transpeptidase [Pseudonocardia acaciae]|uniref:L,D-transpeptidase n=1 Tax=Pseudonocardia acaciae TaxID=551276 RepID=UPI00048DE747|nr:L,D-transpeptidase [Pseudonocardia acaciae]
MSGRTVRRALPLASAVVIVALPLAGTAYAAEPAQSPGLIPGTPCAVGVKACVSLGAQRAWLTDGTKVVNGPIDVISGGLGQETPAGDFAVDWKDRDHKSGEHKTPEGLPSPMPFSVFFAPGGIAFHEGTFDRPSAGCVRLARADAELYFTTLQVGDKVQVKGG